MISEFALFLFTLLGGMAAGAYALAWAFPSPKGTRRLGLPWAALILLIISGVALLLHLGHPERVMHALSNPSAGITREGLATGLFGLLVFIDFIITVFVKKPTPKVLGIVAAIAGVLLLAIIGTAYTSLYGVPAWANWTSMPMFIVGGLATGVAMLPLFDEGLIRKRPYKLCAFVLYALFTCTAIATGLHFSSCGLALAPFVCSAVLAAVVTIVTILLKGREGIGYATLLFILMLAAVIIARYAFYMAV